MIYGMHLTLRVGQIERRDALVGGEKIASLLKALVGRVGMRVLAGPMVAEELGEPERQGWSGVVILYESHAAIHTYPTQREAFVDLFSCKDFNATLVTELLQEFLGDFVVIEQELLDRGYHWGTDVRSELADWHSARGGNGSSALPMLAEPVLAGSK